MLPRSLGNLRPDGCDGVPGDQQEALAGWYLAAVAQRGLDGHVGLPDAGQSRAVVADGDHGDVPQVAAADGCAFIRAEYWSSGDGDFDAATHCWAPREEMWVRHQLFRLSFD